MEERVEGQSTQRVEVYLRVVLRWFHKPGSDCKRVDGLQRSGRRPRTAPLWHRAPLPAARGAGAGEDSRSHGPQGVPAQGRAPEAADRRLTR
jgi:hypothetical protein